MSSAERVLPLHLQIWIPFIAVSVVRNSNTMLNRSSESGHSCLVLDFKGKFKKFSQLNMMSVVGFSQMLFIKLSRSPSISSFLSVFTMKRCWIFVKCFLCVKWDDHLVFCLSVFLLMWYITVINFLMLNYPWILGVIWLGHHV